ncbi:MAG: autotransporter-associated beta strand repeat-containing protein [Bacteroidales bacterium]|jgi:autotransporter-associated beta strand protein|nr:autotransporter-associated beta strand repeat-containing protein [Bacteroidales bacterium]
MKQINFKRFLSLVAAMFFATATTYAQFSWSGTQTLSDGDNITQNITLSGDVTISVPSGATATISGTISGAFALTKTGAGTLVLIANNTYTGATTINGGVLQLGNGGTNGAIATTANIVIKRAGVLTGADSYGYLYVNRSSDLIISKVISSTIYAGARPTGGGVTKLGAGMLLLTGNNTYEGITSVQAGVLSVGNNTSTGAITDNVSVSSGATLRFYRSNDCTYDGVISGAGAVTKTGTGELILGGVSTYTGKTTVTNGKLTIASGGNILNTSEIQLTAATSEISFNNSTEHSYAMPITGAGKLSKAGAGKLNLNDGAATYTGATTLTEGTLTVTGDFASSGIATSAGTILDFYNATANTFQYDGIISGGGVVAKWGQSTWVLAGSNTYTGYTAVREGKLQAGNGTSGNINSTSSVQVYAGAVLRFEPSVATTFSKVISGEGSVEYKGNTSKVLRLTADNTFTGTLTNEAGGILYIGTNNSATGSVVGNIVNNNALYFNRTTDYTYSGVISGTGNLYKQGTNKLTLNGANTYTGTTNISAGTLALGVNGTIVQSSGVTLNSATAKFDISASSKRIKSLSGGYADAEVILGTRALTIGYSGEADGGGTYAGKILGTAAATSNALYKYGTATLTLTGTSTYSGRTLIYNGIVNFNKLDNFGTSTLYCLTNGTLQWAAGNTADVSARLLNNQITVTSFTFDVGANDVTFATAITGDYMFTKKGTGTLTLTAANTPTGTTTVQEGTLAIGGTAGAVAGNIAVDEGATLNFNRNSAYTYAGVISGAGSVEKLGNYTVTLTGANTCTGTTIVSAGTLQIGSGSTTGSIAGNVTVTSVNMLTFNRSNAYTYAGVISGTGSVRKTGSGVLTLSGVNTYNGFTDITDGTIALDATGTIAQSTSVAISATGKFTVTGNKTINALIGISGSSVEINSGILTVACTADYLFSGVISGAGGLTKTGAGTLTLGGVNTYTGATTITLGRLTLDAGGTIANSESVTLGAYMGAYGSLDVSAGNKTLKNLSAGNANNEVILGASTLTLGTGAATADGGGDFKGKFTGTGGVAKTGLQTLVLSGANTATGTFSHAAGTVELSSGWAGNYYQATGTLLDVNGNATVGGTLTLTGGNISMNLTEAPPSKITVTGAVSASGITAMNVTATAGTYTLIQAASGLGSAGNFSFSQPGFTLTPIANGTQLNLTVAVTDVTAPTVGTSTITTSGVTTESLNLAWIAASDDYTTATNLRYFVYQSASNNLTDVENCETNGTLLNAGGTLNITGYTISGLDPNTTYYYNVVVQDQAGNKSVYATKSQLTAKATLSGTVTISGNAVFGQALTAVASELTSTPTIANLGAVTFQWKRGETVVGTNSATYTLVQADIDNTITVTVTTANTQGEITSAATATVAKATQSAPSAPSMASSTHNSITLTLIAGYEYRLSTGTWQSSNVFTDLTPETAYNFHARYAETATHFASLESEASTISTAAAPIPDKVYQGIQALALINAPYNSPKTAAGLGLPATVIINTDQGSVPDVEITWDVAAANYTAGADPEQTFTVTGAIAALPAGVVQPASPLPLTTQVTVTVAARPLNPLVTAVAVTPSTVSVQKGQAQQFSATVTAVDGADESVTWSLTGQSGAGTQISSAGYLTIDAAESAATIAVKATSDFNTAIFGTATVTVTTEVIPPVVNSVTVNPTTASVEQGQSQQFTAIVDAAGGASIAVDWTVDGATSASTFINASGLLTVGGDEPTTSTLTIKATSQFNSATYGTATVTVTAAPATPEVISVTVTPATASVQKGATQQFEATVNAVGGASTDVTWTVDGATSAGTFINASGLLTVGADESAETLTVIATSNFDGFKFGQATVTVTAAPATPEVISVTVNPATASVEQGQSQQFIAIVDAAGGASIAVDWTVDGATSAGTFINASGLLTVGGDEPTTSTLTVKATSQFNSTAYGTATVTVTIAVGMSNIEAAQVVIYPNPATDLVTVKGVETTGIIAIYNASGAQVMCRKITSPLETVSVTHLPAGMYMVRVAEGQKVKAMKLLISK